MPIRINLLAEQLAAEELRRRDPVKRAIWIAGWIVTAVLLWAGFLQLRVIRANGRVAEFDAKFVQIEARYMSVLTNDGVAVSGRERIEALQRLGSNRFLWAQPLNTLQFALVPDIQLVAFKGEQTYQVTVGTSASTNNNRVTPGKPPTSKETIVLNIEGRDMSPKPGEQVFNFQNAISNQSYFKTNLSKIELTQLSPEQTGLTNVSRPFVLFTLQCQYPEKIR